MPIRQIPISDATAPELRSGMATALGILNDLRPLPIEPSPLQVTLTKNAMGLLLATVTEIAERVIDDLASTCSDIDKRELWEDVIPHLIDATAAFSPYDGISARGPMHRRRM